MKLTTKELRTIIKEELEAVMLEEGLGDWLKSTFGKKPEPEDSPESKAAVADREKELKDNENKEAVEYKISQLETAALDAWAGSDQEGSIDDSEHYNPVKTYIAPNGEKRKDPAASKRDVLFLLNKTVGAIGADHKEGQLSVISAPGAAEDQTTLKWEYSYESNTREYGQAFHIWTTFFDEDKWQWTKPEENIDAKADYDPY